MTEMLLLGSRAGKSWGHGGGPSTEELKAAQAILSESKGRLIVRSDPKSDMFLVHRTQGTRVVIITEDGISDGWDERLGQPSWMKQRIQSTRLSLLALRPSRHRVSSTS